MSVDIIKRIIPPKILSVVFKLKTSLIDDYASKIYSQEGEDIILQRIFNRQNKGFFVDVGAHHPKRFSNTYKLYRKGWRGINIDAMPGGMELFNKMRPGDINLEIPISNKEETLTYYIFNEPALNGFSKNLSVERDGQGSYKILSSIDMKTSTLAKVLEEHLSPGTEIDVLSIDVEGMDYEVLLSNDWNKYIPKVVVIENSSVIVDELKNSPLHQFFCQMNYLLFSKLYYSSIYIHKNHASLIK